GVEYDLHTEPVTLAAGGLYQTRVALHRAFATDGWVAADLHLHSANSSDSSLPLTDRVISLAAEGLEFVAATDHTFITDYAPYIAKLGLQQWLTSTVGLELTTTEMGHFNAYPLRFDPGDVRGGEYKWVGEKPDSLFTQLRGLGASPKTIVEVNHPRDGV